jgi:hypothetical protein
MAARGEENKFEQFLYLGAVQKRLDARLAKTESRGVLQIR